MIIVEKQILSKYGDTLHNEDAVWIGESFCMVADGVTSKSGRLFDGKSGGRVAVECIVATLQELRGDEDAETAFERIREKIQKFIEMHDIRESEDIQASVLIYSNKRRELWSVGDCQYLINGTYYKNEKKSDIVLSQLRRMAIEALLTEGYTEAELLARDTAREMILPFLKLQARFVNRKDTAFGYAVVNGQQAVSHIDIHPIPAGSELVMASDGYPVLKDTLEESEALLRQALEEDPLCYRHYPGTKGVSGTGCSFDDRAYLKIIT